MPSLRNTLALLVVIWVSTTATLGQNSVDTSFAPAASITITAETATGKGIVTQADGKPVIFGGNLVVSGVAKGHLARLNVDGTLDTTFSYCNCLLGSVTNVVIQADGKLLVAGNLNNHARVVRLNANGSVDPSFQSAFPLDGGSNSSFAGISLVQPDGKVLVLLSLGFSGFHAGYVVRLNIDGSNDSGFTPINYDGGQSISTSVNSLVLDAAGKIYLATITYSGPAFGSALRRYNADGSADTTWTAPSAGPSGFIYRGLALQADGSLLISGRFDTVNGVSKRDLVRILPAGNVDMNFTAPGLGNGGGQLHVLPSGKILVAYDSSGNGSITRLNADGSPDPTFALSPTVQNVISRFAVDPMGRILFFGLSSDAKYLYFRLNVNGDADTTFGPSVTTFATVRSLGLQADGKVVIAGNFTQMNNLSRTKLARVHPDGTDDPSLDPMDGFDQPPARMLIQPDGKILAAGGFASYRGVTLPGLVRLNADGSIDTSFLPVIEGAVFSIGLQSDGKVLIGGAFTSVDSVARTSVAQLTAAGVLDPTFDPLLGSPTITEIFQQPDGKIIVGGTFSGVNGFNRSNMTRLNNDGSLDQTFNVGTGVGAQRIWLQPDGKYIVSGGSIIRRRNADGTADTSFVGPTFATFSSGNQTIDAVVIQPDGTYIVAGRFDSVNGSVRRNLIRLTSTGSVDPIFFPNGADAAVRAAVRQPDGKIVIGGEFTRVDNVVRAGVARLNVAPYRKPTPFDFDGDGRADISVFRPSTNRWYELFSSNGTVAEETFGISGDILTPADFDGDGITDEAIFRPSNGQWWYHSSVNGSLVLNQYGSSGLIPRPSDFDGDGKADFVLFDPTSGVWSRIGSLTPTQSSNSSFGLAGDQPLIGDFDGDGKSDLAIFRPSNGDWWYSATSAGGAFRNVHWGQNGDIPVPADYDGDGKTDYAVFRPSDGGWYIYNSGNGSFTTTAFGISTDRPVAADYDGDGRADIAVFRPSTGIWYLLRSTSGFAGYQFGISTDVALPGSLIP
ncbi:MAG: FG-GAP-like repeat-containing protein [Pyrinomonadaceae bacterium]